MLRGAWPEITEEEYLIGFDRRNLVIGEWNRQRAKISADTMKEEFRGADRVIALLGKDVQRAFGVEADPLDRVRFSASGPRYYCVPHPSGMNQWYNVPANRNAVGVLLADMLYEHPHD